MRIALIRIELQVQAIPSAVAESKGSFKLAAGYYHALALLSEGESVVQW
jgi:hypothetical protein